MPISGDCSLNHTVILEEWEQENGGYLETLKPPAHPICLNRSPKQYSSGDQGSESQRQQ